MVDHVLGRGREDYIGRGATDQMIADCMLLLSADSAGLIFDFTGSLSDRGWLAPVELSLKQ